ncbi:MAG: DUF2887 domain-containing protein, partial [Thermosynechococcaceae cyanobacterium]
VTLMVLTTVDEQQAPEEARHLLSRTQQEASPSANRAIIDMVITIISYRFEQLSRKEVENMLSLAMKETRVYREIKEEGRQEGRQEGREEGREEGRQEAASLVIGLLEKRFGLLTATLCARVEGLSLPVLKSLTIESIDFSDLDDLHRWLNDY